MRGLMGVVYNGHAVSGDVQSTHSLGRVLTTDFLAQERLSIHAHEALCSQESALIGRSGSAFARRWLLAERLTSGMARLAADA